MSGSVLQVCTFWIITPCRHQAAQPLAQSARRDDCDSQPPQLID